MSNTRNFCMQSSIKRFRFHDNQSQKSIFIQNGILRKFAYYHVIIIKCGELETKRWATLQSSAFMLKSKYWLKSYKRMENPIQHQTITSLIFSKVYHVQVFSSIYFIKFVNTNQQESASSASVHKSSIDFPAFCGFRHLC